MTSSNSSADRIRKLQEQRDRLLITGEMETVVAPELAKQDSAPGTKTWDEVKKSGETLAPMTGPNAITEKQKTYLMNLCRSIGLSAKWVEQRPLSKRRASRAIEIILEVKAESWETYEKRERAKDRLELEGIL